MNTETVTETTTQTQTSTNQNFNILSQSLTLLLLAEDTSKLTVDTTKDPNAVKEEEIKSSEKSATQKATLDDFIIINSLGRGAYGEVVLVQKKSGGKKYAMKIMDKNFMRRVKLALIGWLSLTHL